MKIVTACILFAVLGTGVAGCSAVSVTQDKTGTTIKSVEKVPNSDIATTAASAIANKFGWSPTPDMTCGTGSSPLVVGQTFTCVLTDPDNNKDYVFDVTIIKVNGAKFQINVGDGKPVTS